MLTADGQRSAYSYLPNSGGGNLSLLSSDGTWTYTYDGNGNRITRSKSGENWTYNWDLHNRLTSVSKNGAVIASYTYDIENLRVAKTKGSATSVYAYRQDGVIAYQKDLSALTARTYAYIGSTTLGWTDTKADGTKTNYFAVTDQVGSVTQVTDGTGAVVWSSEYLAFGVIAGRDGPYDFDGSYAGHEYDADVGLVYMWNRWMDPATGGFISEDSAQDGQNWYSHVANSPLRYIDPEGRNLWDTLVSFGSGISKAVSSAYNSTTKFIGDMVKAQSFLGIINWGDASATSGLDINLGIFSISIGPKGIEATIWAPLLGVPDPMGHVGAGVIWGGPMKGVYASYQTLGFEVEVGIMNNSVIGTVGLGAFGLYPVAVDFSVGQNNWIEGYASVPFVGSVYGRVDNNGYATYASFLNYGGGRYTTWSGESTSLKPGSWFIGGLYGGFGWTRGELEGWPGSQPWPVPRSPLDNIWRNHDRGWSSDGNGLAKRGGDETENNIFMGFSTFIQILLW